MVSKTVPTNKYEPPLESFYVVVGSSASVKLIDSLGYGTDKIRCIENSLSLYKEA
jgi:hypothetical protein